jgi:hypothetical protein
MLSAQAYMRSRVVCTMQNILPFAENLALLPRHQRLV